MAGGRPEKVIDWDQVEKLASIFCTQEEIAFIVGVSVDTLDRRSKKRNGCSFAEFCRQKGAFGKMSLRRAMWQKALDGDNTMMIWLSKQHLDMAEKNENFNYEEKPLEVKFGWADEDNPSETDGASEEDSGE